MTNYADSFFEYQNSVRFSRHIPDSLPNIKILSGFLTKFSTVSLIPTFCPLFSSYSGQFSGYQNSVRFSCHIPDSLPNTKILSGFLAIFRTVSPDTKILSGLKRKLYQYNHQYLILPAFRYFSMQLSEIDSLENLCKIEAVIFQFTFKILSS